MAYEIVLDQQFQLIHMKFTSPDSLDEHLNATTDIQHLIKKHNTKKVLINLFNMHQHTQLSITEQHEFTRKWKHEDYKDCLFAIVLPEEIQLQDDWYFITHLIKLSGTIGLPFYTQHEAVEWLTAK